MLCWVIDVINLELLVHFLGEFHWIFLKNLANVRLKFEQLVIYFSTKFVIIGKLCFPSINLDFFFNVKHLLNFQYHKVEKKKPWYELAIKQ
jgi:hypothetical protein